MFEVEIVHRLKKKRAPIHEKIVSPPPTLQREVVTVFPHHFPVRSRYLYFRRRVYGSRNAAKFEPPSAHIEVRVGPEGVQRMGIRLDHQHGEPLVVAPDSYRAHPNEAN